MSRRHVFVADGLLLLLIGAITACQPQTVVETRVVEVEVTRIVEVEGEQVVVTQVVEVEGETVVVTATPRPSTVLITVTQMVTRIITRVVTTTPEGTQIAAATPTLSSFPATPAPSSAPLTQEPLLTPSPPLPTPASTSLPYAVGTPTPIPTSGPITATPAPADHQVEVEWPPRLRTGESGLVRLTLWPTDSGFVAAAEMPNNEVMLEAVSVEPQPGYELRAAAALHGIAFTIGPENEQWQPIDPTESAEWRWTVMTETPGNQTLNLTLTLHWLPLADNPEPARQKQVFGQAFQVQVRSWLGLTMPQAMLLGVVGLALGSGLSWPLVQVWWRPPYASRRTRPNRDVTIEPHPAIPLNPVEMDLLQAQFRAYRRVLVEAEFRSGYSGARTLLALPIRDDNRHDAAAIIKIGSRRGIEQEFANYETFVQNTLPPLTARILSRPQTTRQPRSPHRLASLRYTFIGEPGQKPTSLRQQLLRDPDPAWLEKLFRTFGANWWRQHQPYRYRLATEFDRKLPAHLVLQPVGLVRGRVSGQLLDGSQPLTPGRWSVGDTVELRHFRVAEYHPEGSTPGGYLALLGQVAEGQIPPKLRWLGETYREGQVGRVVATRESLLERAVGREPLAVSEEEQAVGRQLPAASRQPLAAIPSLLNETIQGTRSVIHGDLNLENILVGPDGGVWLIDFAETRLGPPVYDFAHLGAELIAHVIAPQESDAAAIQYQPQHTKYPLLSTQEMLAIN